MASSDQHKHVTKTRHPRSSWRNSCVDMDVNIYWTWSIVG